MKCYRVPVKTSKLRYYGWKVFGFSKKSEIQSPRHSTDKWATTWHKLAINKWTHFRLKETANLVRNRSEPVELNKIAKLDKNGPITKSVTCSKTGNSICSYYFSSLGYILAGTYFKTELISGQAFQTSTEENRFIHEKWIHWYNLWWYIESTLRASWLAPCAYQPHPYRAIKWLQCHRVFNEFDTKLRNKNH